MEVVRLVAYTAGLIGAAMVVGVLIGTRQGLGKALAGSYVVWAVNCAVLGSMLAWSVAAGETPALSSLAWTVNALLLAVAPFIAFRYLWRNGHDGRDSGRG